MLDIETLGRGPGCVVTSVAITPFHMNGTMIFPNKVFKCKLSISDQLIKGFTLEPETHEWWMQQDPKVRESEFSGITSPERFCDMLIDYINLVVAQFKTYRIWASAPKLDFGCMFSLFTATKRAWPIIFSSERCMRTYREMTKTLYPSFVLPKGAPNHCAEDDTNLQIKQIQACYTRLKENSEINTAQSGTTRTGKVIHADVRPEVCHVTDNPM